MSVFIYLDKVQLVFLEIGLTAWRKGFHSETFGLAFSFSLQNSVKKKIEQNQAKITKKKKKTKENFLKDSKRPHTEYFVEKDKTYCRLGL